MTILDSSVVSERLGSLDLANPVLRKNKVERYFTRFVIELSAFKAGPPPIYWLPGVSEWRSKALDLGLYGRYTEIGIPWRQHYNFNNSMYIQQILNVGDDLFTLRVLRSIISDQNFLLSVEEGLGFFVLNRHGIVLIPRPRMRLRQESPTLTVLHSAVGPAVHFPGDHASDQFWLRGVRVPRFVVETPDRITSAHIRAARTTALRHTLIDQYGLLRYSAERGFKPADTAPELGATLYVKGGNRARYGGTTLRQCIIELVNSTPEPDGTHRHFARRVPQGMQSAKEAVAWTFGFDKAEEYNPKVQT